MINKEYKLKNRKLKSKFIYYLKYINNIYFYSRNNKVIISTESRKHVKICDYIYKQINK